MAIILSTRRRRYGEYHTSIASYAQYVHRQAFSRQGQNADAYLLAAGSVAGVMAPFDMTARNNLDRFHLAINVLNRLPVADDRAYMIRHGEGISEIRVHLAAATRRDAVNSFRPLVLRRYPL
ncbi:MAG: phosphoketolase family protein [Sulfuricaulis sp.]